MARSFWRSFSLTALALLLAVAMTITLVHWHRDGAADRCLLCHARQISSIEPVLGNPVPVPVVREWREVEIGRAHV